MGKQGKKQRHHNQHKTSRRGGGGAFFNSEEDDNDHYPPSSSTSKLTLSDEEKQSEEEEAEAEAEAEAEGPSEDQNDQNPSTGDNVPSKFSLYQQSVQSPKGDISYLQKFFLMYVGGRLPLHLQEDFCGTALLSDSQHMVRVCQWGIWLKSEIMNSKLKDWINCGNTTSVTSFLPSSNYGCFATLAFPKVEVLSTEWLHTDSRRTAVGIDLDHESLNWCMENNLNKTGADGYSRIYLFHGNVLNPLEARLVKFENQYLLEKVTLSDVVDDGSETTVLDSAAQENPGGFTDGRLMKDFPLLARDIICAFNYSCCCLHSRVELVSYFNHSHNALSRKGGIFVMDLYGGTSSECELRLQRKFPNFTYVWEQAGFDIVQRKTRISLHFHLQKQQKKLRHAFSYSWRLWSLPEIKDCLEEAGFRSVHFWIRQMPDAGEIRSIKGFGSGRDVKYEEVSSFEQQDSWNAYVVGVA